MIVKKVPNRRKVSAKAKRISVLVNYICNPGSVNRSEKCIYANARGFLADDPLAQTQEMIALAVDAVRSVDPINHYVLSWREGEQPTSDQIEGAVTIFLAELGLSGHQVVYGLHADTDNIHLHLCVNRVVPWELRSDEYLLSTGAEQRGAKRSQKSLPIVVEINRGFDLEVAHKAIARIEHAQGWRREKNARYRVSENGDVVRVHGIDSQQRPSTRKADMEVRTGEKSAERIAIEIAAPVIAKSQGWDALHAELAAQGIRYEKTGSGATIFVGDIGVKASSVDRKASLVQLAKRLGVFVSAGESLTPSARAIEPLVQGIPDWPEYIGCRRQHYDNRAHEAKAMQRRHADERQTLVRAQRTRRSEILAGNWRGRGHLLNAMRSVLAMEQAAVKANLKQRHKAERDSVRQSYGCFPDLEQWLRDRYGAEAGRRWRHRLNQAEHSLSGGIVVPAMPSDIRSFRYELLANGHVHYRPVEDGWASFVDYGEQVGVFAFQDEAAVLAALQLSAQKWPKGIRVEGDDGFKRLCARLAAAHGIKLQNPELQPSIDQEGALVVGDRDSTAGPASLEI